MIAIILGTRPEIIKLSPIVRELTRLRKSFFIIHTNQHYSPNMDSLFFEELKIPQPKFNLHIRENTHGAMVGTMINKIEEILLNTNPNIVLVQGDTNTTLAGSIAASKIPIKLGHVESGLRSYDRSMPEEINRIIIDHVSDLLFCPTQKQANIAVSEGIEKNKIKVTGNTIVDAVNQNLKLALNVSSFDKYKRLDYGLITLHRPSNVDAKKSLYSIISTIENISDIINAPIYFPVHPRTKKQLCKFKLKVSKEKIQLLEPVGYLQMLAMEKYAKIILTDSGGIQEEACILNVPCVTLRDNTERPETLEVKSNILVGNKPDDIIDGVNKMLTISKKWENPFGDGKSGRRIVNYLNI